MAAVGLDIVPENSDSMRCIGSAVLNADKMISAQEDGDVGSLVRWGSGLRPG